MQPALLSEQSANITVLQINPSHRMRHNLMAACNLQVEPATFLSEPFASFADWGPDSEVTISHDSLATGIRWLSQPRLNQDMQASLSPHWQWGQHMQQT